MTLCVQVSKRRGDFALDVQFTAPTPGVVALFGRSGCGKSTTINLIAGLLRADSGRIQVGDEVWFDAERGIDVPVEQRRIGYVFQNARLFPHYTVRGNLNYGLRRARHAVLQSFDAIVQLLGLAPLLERRPAQLSGGEQQRVALGRALLRQPQLLLLDEPLASLDQARRTEVLPYLERVRDELRVPMVYVSHQYEEVLHLATHVVLLDHGQVLGQGDLPTVSLHPGLRSVVGAESLGSVLEGEVLDSDAAQGIARLRVGAGELRVEADHLSAGQRVRVQLLARDLILALQPVTGLSVRNQLPGHIVALEADGPHSVLVHVDLGGALVLARVTSVAAAELRLAPGLALHVLLKAVTLRGHLFRAADA